MRKIDNIMFILIVVLGTILTFLLFLLIMCGFGFLIYKGILMLISLL